MLCLHLSSADYKARRLLTGLFKITRMMGFKPTLIYDDKFQHIKFLTLITFRAMQLKNTKY